MRNPPQVAYERAIELGNQCNTSYYNEAGKLVKIRFRGLRDLDVIHDPLGDGCEIMYFEKLGVTPDGIKKLIRPKKSLEAFKPIKRQPGRPDFSSKEIMDAVRRKLIARM